MQELSRRDNNNNMYQQNNQAQYQQYREPLHNQDHHYQRKHSYSSSDSSHHHFHEGMSDEDRIGFIRKVYGILSAQLSLTAFMCLIPYLSDSVRAIMVSQFWLVILSMVMAIVLVCTLFCVPSLARKVPTNYYLMFAFTICESYSIAFVCAAVNDAKTVLAAAAITAAIVVSLTIYALTTKKDFTVMGGMIFVFSACLLMFGVFTMFWGYYARVVYCCLGLILFGLYLIIDTQMICGGKRYSVSKEDYIYGAIILYLDILNIFLFVLQLLSSKND
ncbi:UNKNOWN [Stylonychia lemnae]|uniref:Nmda receptor glutamate-binding chain n=1 Tax=Stylonychia lemnae TaxID=5949 RepID=A0A078AEG0_STYLE|nr:UNKNOWN [Stylonychia lemnae]|eukprot:CDW79303.1 UNKNOWN [Stylonychia lemnae]